MILIVVAFILNKGVFGKPLHLSSDVCFIVSLIVFYMLSKSVPGTSLSILFPILIGVTLSLISSIVGELLFPNKAKNLRQKILDITGLSPTKELIYSICKDKGFTDNKATDVSETVYIYLSNSQYETAEIMCCDNRTVTRRINEFIKD